jgi:hypothetical protein
MLPIFSSFIISCSLSRHFLSSVVGVGRCRSCAMRVMVEMLGQTFHALADECGAGPALGQVRGPAGGHCRRTARGTAGGEGGLLLGRALRQRGHFLLHRLGKEKLIIRLNAPKAE